MNTHRITFDKHRSLIIRLAVFAIVCVCAETASAQPYTTTAPNDILAQYQAFQSTWTTNIWTYANGLFTLLALIEFTWSAIALVLDKTDLQSWTAGLIRRVMWLGAFYALLINGRTWIPAVIGSFEEIGFTSAGLGAPLDPGAVFAQGLAIAGKLMEGAGLSGYFTNFGTSLALVIAAVIIVVAFVIITINFVVTLVESYLVLSAGFLFLGFGGSRWTAPYTERYIGLAVSTGVKLLLLYCVIAAGSTLSSGWLIIASDVGTAPQPATTAFDIMGASLIYMMICWQIPKLFSAVLGGAPALTGGDLAGMGMTIIGAAGAAATLGTGVAAAGAGRLAGGAAASTAAGAATGSGGGTNSVASMVNAVSAANTNVDPPSSSGGAKNGRGTGTANSAARNGTANDVASVSSPNVSGPSNKSSGADNSSTLAAVGGEALAGSGFEGERPAKGFSSVSADVASVGSSKISGDPTPVTPSNFQPVSGEPLRGSGFEGEKLAQSFAPKGTDGRAESPSGAADVTRVAGPQIAPGSARMQRLAAIAKQTDRGLRSAQDRLQEARRRLGPISDAASPPSPPRMPIDSND